MDWFERDIAEMKADTLSRLGRRIEITVEMLQEEEGFKARLEAMVKRIDEALTSDLPRKKRKQYEQLEEQLKEKLEKSQRALSHVVAAKQKAIEDYKAQREILGITDHTFIDEYIAKMENESVKPADTPLDIDKEIGEAIEEENSDWK